MGNATVDKTSVKAKGMTFTARKRIGSAVTSIVMIAISLVCAVPLWYIVINTFKTIADMNVNPLGLPNDWTFDNYINAFKTVPILRSLWNTVIVTFFGVAIQVIVGALAAYGMILRKSRFTSAVGAVLMVAFVVPAQSTLIPLYRMEAGVHLVNTLAGLVLIYLGGAVFCYFLIVGYMRSLPFELIEAARIDGAGPLRIFWNIVMPLIKPILTTVIVFQTIGYVERLHERQRVHQLLRTAYHCAAGLQRGRSVLDRLAELHDHHRTGVAAGVYLLHLLPEVDCFRLGRRFRQRLIGFGGRDGAESSVPSRPGRS